MSPRIAVELTSERPDGTWTWRAAGAREPKGVLDGKLLPEGAGVGDVVRAEADIDLEGITVTTVLAPKGQRRQPQRLEVLGPPGEEPGVTTTRVERGRDGPRGQERKDRSDGPPGPRRNERPRPERDHPPREQPRRPRPGPHRPEDGATSARHERRPRPPRPEIAPRPKAKKLRPRRTHRDALLAALPQEQLPIAEQAMRGGMPAVRTALEEQNAEARREGKPEAPSAAVLAIAEGLLPRVRVAEWLDRADAALADVEELALADLRSVVVSADDVARDEQTREPAATLRAALDRRTEVEQGVWQRDMEQSLEGKRVVRALRLSSRAPQPGERLDPEMATRLSEAAGAAMTADIAVDRWATLLDAVAYSAVRRSVTPAGIPAEPGEELLAQVRKHARRVPAIATLFGLKPAAQSTARAPRRGPPSAGPSKRPAGSPTAGAPLAGVPDRRVRRIPPPPGVPGDAIPVVADDADSTSSEPPAPLEDSLSTSLHPATLPEPVSEPVAPAGEVEPEADTPPAEADTPPAEADTPAAKAEPDAKAEPEPEPDAEAEVEAEASNEDASPPETGTSPGP